MVAFAVVYFLYFYAGHSARPGAAFRLGWFGWYDQGQYLIEARAIRGGLLDPKLYQYPFGYPAVGALFLGITRSDPFIVPNLLAFAATIGLFYEICRRYLGNAFAVLGSLLLIAATPLTDLTVVPWTTTPALLTVAFWAYLALVRQKVGYALAATGGALLAWTYAARGGGEIALLSPLGAALLWHFRKEEKIWIKSLIALGVFVAGAAVNLWWTREVFGSFVHPYFRAVLARGFRPSAIPSSLWGALVYSGKEGEFWPPLLRQGFWLILAPVGMVLAVMKAERRAVHLALAIGLVATFLVTASFPAFNARHLKFYALHYVKAWFPIAGFYALYSLKTLFVRGVESVPGS